ncbi:MAG TPA: hypothetical protein DF383_06340 [Deltaproteobacteria bacterium]|nr:hypothetical protein [Deltaproteobacteria bacterium]
MPPYRVIALGDSLTYGYPFGKNLSWVKLAEQELRIPFLNQGVNGDTFREMLRRLTIDVLDLKPEFCIVLGGANDVYQGMAVALMQSNLSKIASLLKKNKIKPLLGLSPPLRDEVFEKELGKFRRWVKRFAKDHRFVAVDFYSPFLDSKKKRLLPSCLEDGVHPSLKGYQSMAKAAVEVLQHQFTVSRKGKSPKIFQIVK